MKKRLLSILLVVCMVCTLLPVSAFAADADNKCGYNLTWEYSDGVLTISGAGPMFNYDAYSPAPWYSFGESITTLVLPDGLTSIGNTAFEGCSSLMNVTIPEGVQIIGSEAFCSCSSLTSVVIPATVTNLGSYMTFGYCSKLTSIVIPGSVKSIPDHAFFKCSSLTSVALPKSVTSIGMDAFDECNKLEDFYYAGSVKDGKGITVYGGNDPLIQAHQHFNVTDPATHYVMKSTTATCTQAGTTVFACSCGFSYEVDVAAFGHDFVNRECTRCGEFNIVGVSETGSCGKTCSYALFPDGNFYVYGSGDMYDYTYSTQSSCSFYSCKDKIKHVYIGKDITRVGNFAFYGYNMESVCLLDPDIALGNWAFGFCGNLTDIDFGSGTVSLAENVFEDCKALTEVTIPETVVMNGNYSGEGSGYDAFHNCSSLKTAVVDCAYVGPFFFENDKALTRVTFTNPDVQLYWVDHDCNSGHMFNTMTSGWSPITLVGYECSDVRVFCEKGNARGTSYGSDWPQLTFESISGDPKTHVPVTDSGFAATCTKAGLTDGSHCSKCGKVLERGEQIPIDPDAHSFVGGVCEYCGTPEPASIIASGTDGNITWSLDENGLLTIDGEGAMKDYYDTYDSTHDLYRTNAPWGSYYSSIESVVINSGVTSIGDDAFYNCSNLASVTIPDTVTDIGLQAFCYCSFENVTIPDSVTSIDNDAFHYCTELTSVTIPASVTNLGLSVFAGCTKLNNINVASGNKNFTSVDGVLLTKDEKTLHDYPAGRSGAYTIPDGITNIEGRAFNDCSGLTSVTIPASVTSIGNNAFRSCTALESAKFEGNAPTTVAVAADTLFYNCASGFKILAPENNDTWKGDAYNAEAGTWNGYPIEFYSVGPAIVASGTDGNITWTLDSNGLLTISGTGEMEDYYEYSYGYSIPPWYSNRSSIVSVVIGDGVTSIGAYAFEGCSNLASVTIGSGVTSIGAQAFDGCSGLTSVTIPDSVTSIGIFAFYGCSGLTSVTIPGSVQSIGRYAFYGCSGLTSVTIPDSVTSIGDFAFAYCSGLTSVTIGSGVTSIGASAFYNYSRLSHIYFKGSMPTIGSNAFSNVSAFAFYPGSDESYANAGTYDARKLIWLPDGDPEEMIYSGDCGENIVWRLTRSGTLKLSGSGNMYNYTALSQPWKDISFGITGAEIADGIKSIGSDAFCNCYSLTSVTIPDSVTSIGSQAFMQCSGLTSVTIPDGVQSIGSAAFLQCSGLTSVTIPDSVTSIGTQAFDGCSGLTSVTFEGKPNSICSDTFSYVTATAHYYLEDNWPASKLQDYGGKLTWKMLTRHSLDSENLTVLPESVHDYPANYNEKFEIAEDGAVYLTLKFSAETSLGTSDILFVVDQNGKTVASYTGTQAAGQTLVVDGSKATIWINADDVGSGYGFKLDSVKVDYLHHIYSDVVTAPTCTEQGYTTRTCEFCGAVSVGSYVDALGHNFVEGICTRCHTLEVADSGSCGSYAKWTLGTNGVLTITGSGSVTSSPWRTNHAADIKSVVIGKDITYLCDYAFYGCTNLSSAAFEGKAVSLGGSYVFYNCAPDFTVTATKGDVSWTRSGAYNEQDGTWNGYKIVFVGGHDHAYSEVITLEPTCTEVGYKTRTCAVCGDVEIIPISARGHVYDIVVTDPCCTKGGYTTYTCKYCDYSYEGDYIIATGHNFNASVIAATCTTAGYTLHTCSCGVFYTSDYVEATGHSYTQKVIAPTCTASGYTLNTCSCGVSTITDPLPATGHDFGEWVMTVQPSCIQTGIETRTCSDCGFLEMHDTGVFGSHVTNLVGAVTATCGSAGYTGDEVCEICENVVTAGKQIEPCAHAWGEVVYTWAEDGSSCTAKCVCANDAKHVETATAVITSKVTTPATCTEMGTTTYTATFDEEWAETQILKLTDVAKLPHTYGAPVFTWNGYNCSAAVVCSCGDTQSVKCTVTSAVTKEATTKAEGVRTYTATVTIDGHTYTSTKTESIPKLDDGGSTNFFTAFIEFIRKIINSILSIFKF